MAHNDSRSDESPDLPSQLSETRLRWLITGSSGAAAVCWPICLLLYFLKKAGQRHDYLHRPC